MAKYLGYICLYTNKEVEALFDTPSKILHFRYIQKFNFVQKKLKCDGIGRINLIMTDSPEDHLQMERCGEIMNILFFVDEKIHTHSEIYTFYTKILTDIWMKCTFELDPLNTVLNLLTDFHLPWDYVSRTLYNQSRTYGISLKVHVDVTVELYLIVHKPNGANHLVLFSKVNFDMFISDTIKYYCNKKYWRTDLKFIIELANNRDYWEYDVESDTIKFVFPRAEANNPHGLYDLGQLYMEGLYVLKDIDMAKHFLQLSVENGYSRAGKALEELAKLQN